MPVAPVLVTLLALCVPPPTSHITSSGQVTDADVASAMLVAWCFLRLLRDRSQQLRNRLLTPTAAVVLGAPALAFAVATAASSDPSASLPGFVRYLQIFVVVPAAVLLLLRDARDFRLVCGTLVLVSLFQGGLGVVQNLTGTGASYMGQNIRAVGTFGALDIMGMSTVVAFGLVAALALGLTAPKDSSRLLRIGALCCAAALVAPLILSFSRGTWIATAVACTVVLLLAGVRRAVLVLTALAAAAVVVVGGFGAGSDLVGERFTSITDVSTTPDRSVTDRYNLWSAATSIWRDAPVVGVGIKNFPAQRDGHASLGLSSGSDTAGAGIAFQREPLLSPHSMYLLILSEQGLLGITAVAGSWAALLVCGVRRLYGARRAARSLGTAGDGGVAGCGVAAVGLLVWQVVDFVYGDIGGPSTVLTAIILGLIAWWALSPATGEADEAFAR